MSDLTHLNPQGEAHMVDVGGKPATQRVAIAEGRIHMAAATLEALRQGDLKKGDALGTARIAGIIAAKRTAELIPLCHPLPLTHLEVTLTPEPENLAVHCEVQAETRGQTGVEIEALTAVQTALLTVYDMCKALDRGMQIDGVALTHKRGGRTGDWSR
ncbi:cyclic pyranopterin monophosphate synthase MoaC [Spiribacter salinus]|uniref:cyclic pyranopterin monophosphate synthase MoaC n=1 Tax=Spiribacter salinus TaxID=1335746 RepID=UPI001C96F01C|nr:cyclic pyranopterin monophosphate synthase MoaC [Spiribacter salinus]MBY5268166.1 molybdenum cofactor biosynthesis protein C [Spiribacter salinus]